MNRAAVLNYHHAELLFHVLRSRTLTDAARTLHISQPAVSKQLRQLEDSLGIKLFNRDGRRLVPTVEALALADQIERTHASIVALNELAGNVRSGAAGRITVCAIPAMANILLPPAIETFYRSFPQVRVDVKVENSWRILDLVESQQVDVGIAFRNREIKHVRSAPLMHSPIVCAVPRDDPLASNDKLPLIALRDRRIVILDLFDGAPEIGALIKTAGIDRQICCCVSTSSLACEIALRTQSIALVDEITARSYEVRGLTCIPLEGIPTRTVELLRPDLRPASHIAEAFILIIEDVSKRLTDEQKHEG